MLLFPNHQDKCKIHHTRFLASLEYKLIQKMERSGFKKRETGYSTRSSSTSNINVALGGIIPGCPRDPYAIELKTLIGHGND